MNRFPDYFEEGDIIEFGDMIGIVLGKPDGYYSPTLGKLVPCILPYKNCIAYPYEAWIKKIYNKEGNKC